MFGLFSSTFGGVVSRDNTQPQSNGNVVSTFTVPVAVNQITDDELTCPVCTFNVKESGMFDTGDEVRLVKLPLNWKLPEPSANTAANSSMITAAARTARHGSVP